MTTYLRHDTAYLVPRTLGCPTICWKRPQVEIVDHPAGPYVTVRVDGEEVTRDIHIDNLAKSVPAGTEPRMALERRVKPLELPPGWEEMPLW